MQCKTDYMSDLVVYKDRLETQGHKLGKETLKLILLIDDITKPNIDLMLQQVDG